MQTLRVANVGDSGFVVVRDSTVVARSEPMIRGFNFPYQIGTDGDDPEMAEVRTFGSPYYQWPEKSNEACICVNFSMWYLPLVISSCIH